MRMRVSPRLSAVAAAPGIARVMSATRIPGKNDCAPVYGDPVFADTEVVISRQCLPLPQRRWRRPGCGWPCQISYEELPAVITIEAAMQAGSFQTGSDRGVRRS